ncbi:unnamed protein product [Tenebrio molitor]|nr:unnamed protein product [Tenebrio molitor]
MSQLIASRLCTRGVGRRLLTRNSDASGTVFLKFRDSSKVRRRRRSRPRRHRTSCHSRRMTFCSRCRFDADVPIQIFSLCHFLPTTKMNEQCFATVAYVF